MDSKEFGLIAAQQLFKTKNLHYGFWEVDDLVCVEKLHAAQDKHTNFLFKYIDRCLDSNNKKERATFNVLDAGCGIGITTKKLLELGYNVDGLVPSKWMAQQAAGNIREHEKNGHIYRCKLEEFTPDKKYDVVFFSESFQYVNMNESFDVLRRILNESGKVIIFDFFSKDNIPGTSPLGGGHSMGEFYRILEEKNFCILLDIDVTLNMSKNLKLVNDLLVDRIIPFIYTTDHFLLSRRPILFKIIKFILRRKINKLKRKYSAQRNEENFIKYKSYRLIQLKIKDVSV